MERQKLLVVGVSVVVLIAAVGAWAWANRDPNNIGGRVEVLSNTYTTDAASGHIILHETIKSLAGDTEWAVRMTYTITTGGLEYKDFFDSSRIPRYGTITADHDTGLVASGDVNVKVSFQAW